MNKEDIDELWKKYMLDLCEGNTEIAFKKAIKEALSLAEKKYQGLLRTLEATRKVEKKQEKQISDLEAEIEELKEDIKWYECVSMVTPGKLKKEAK